MKNVHLRYKDQNVRQRTWTIHLIALEKVVKGVLLIVAAFKLLSLVDHDVNAWATDFVTRHGIDAGNRFVHAGLEKLVGIDNNQIYVMSIIAFFYSALLFTEGLGLWFQKRWAEYLTAIATALLLPLEIYELYEKFTWVRIVILAINVFIVWYLATRLSDESKEL
jgi:uncharacterized membrane protein (DUF2068 family)